MLGSAILFFDWRFGCLPSLLKPKATRADRSTESNAISRHSLVQHVKDPLFIVVTLFLPRGLVGLRRPRPTPASPQEAPT